MDMPNNIQKKNICYELNSTKEKSSIITKAGVKPSRNNNSHINFQKTVNNQEVYLLTFEILINYLFRIIKLSYTKLTEW